MNLLLRIVGLYHFQSVATYAGLFLPVCITSKFYLIDGCSSGPLRTFVVNVFCHSVFVFVCSVLDFDGCEMSLLHKQPTDGSISQRCFHTLNVDVLY